MTMLKLVRLIRSSAVQSRQWGRIPSRNASRDSYGRSDVTESIFLDGRRSMAGNRVIYD